MNEIWVAESLVDGKWMIDLASYDKKDALDEAERCSHFHPARCRRFVCLEDRFTTYMIVDGEGQD